MEWVYKSTTQCCNEKKIIRYDTSCNFPTSNTMWSHIFRSHIYIVITYGLIYTTTAFIPPTTMSLYLILQSARTKENVKNTSIKALGLKDTVSISSISTPKNPIWSQRMRQHKHIRNVYPTLTLYPRQPQQRLISHALPLCYRQRKIAIMKTSDALPLLEKKTIKQKKSASDVTHISVLENRIFLSLILPITQTFL